MSFMDAPRVDVLYGCPRAFGKIYDAYEIQKGPSTGIFH